jgi:tetraacyldisaccharide 4'-kinase
MRPYWHKLFARLHPGTAPEEADGARDSSAAVPSLLELAAAPLAALYSLGARVRRGLYRRGLFRTQHLPAPVISIGNLTVGGTGKTPMAALIARLCQEQGRSVAILSRGYGGRTRGVVKLADAERIHHRPPEVGEEPYWLARTLPGVAVYTGAARFAAGLAAWQDCRPDLFLLDDGFQHFQLHRDLDIVLLDAAAPFGNGRLLPRGPLREPISALDAAQVLILTRYDELRHRSLRDSLQITFPEKLVLTAAIAPVRARAFPGGHEEPPEALRHRLLLPFAGLARPGVFAQTLQQLGADLKGFAAFPDHYDYRPEDLRALADQARARGAGALVTTAKDWARLGEKWEGDLLLWVLDVEARLEQPEQLLRYINESGRKLV